MTHLKDYWLEISLDLVESTDWDVVLSGLSETEYAIDPIGPHPAHGLTYLANVRAFSPTASGLAVITAAFEEMANISGIELKPRPETPYRVYAS